MENVKFEGHNLFMALFSHCYLTGNHRTQRAQDHFSVFPVCFFNPMRIQQDPIIQPEIGWYERRPPELPVKEVLPLEPATETQHFIGSQETAVVARNQLWPWF